MKFLLRHIITTLIAFVLVALFAFTAYKVPFMSPMAEAIEDYKMTDVYYHILQDTDDGDTSDVVTIVDMSDLYSRRELATALKAIEQCQPRVIGIDVVFEGLKEDSVGDEMIAEVALTHKNLVFSYKLLDYENDSIGHAITVHSFFAQDEGAVTEGYTNMPRNLYGGLKRELSLGDRAEGKLVPSFITQTVAVYEGQKAGPVRQKNLNINYTPRKYHVVSPDSIALHSEYIKDKLVLFGAMKDEYDMHYTPLGKMAGVELLAYAVETFLRQNEIREVNKWATAVISFLIVLLTQMLLSVYAYWAQHRRIRFFRVVLSASITKGYLIFFFIGFWMWVAFILFYSFDFTLNLGWALSAMAFLILARSIYDEIIMVLLEKKNGK
jgi:CHASE2 domain-containing sensor protein